MFDVIIIGAGASGLFCWSQLPKRQKKLILEKTAHIGTKVLLSGKGRCNFTNLKTDKEHYLGDSIERLAPLFEEFWAKEMIDLLKVNGILSKEEDNGRILLQSNTSKELVDFLIQANQENGTEIRTACEVMNIKKESDFFLVQTHDSERITKKIILATGGCSFPKIGASNFIFEIANSFDLQVKQAQPALCGITTQESLELLSGSSVFAKLQLFEGRLVKYESEGMILFTHWGISGPLIFNTSLCLGYHYGNQFKNLKIRLTIPTHQMTKRLLTYLNAPKGLKTYALTLTPKALRSRDEAKVMSGGILFEEVDDNFEVKRRPGICILGEGLNITGETGGFNLQRCWTSAFHCAKGLK